MNWSVTKDPTILTTAAVYGLLEYITTRAGLFGLWLGILLLISLGRYCYAVLRATAQGRRHIPAPTLESANPVGEIMVLLHLLLFPGLIIATAPWQPWGAAVAVIVAFVFPASASLMGLSGSIEQAVNPRACLGVARTMGQDYLILVAGYVGIFVFASLLPGILLPGAGILAAALAFFAGTWALLAAFALVGSALRAHRLDFDIPGEVVPVEEKDRSIRHNDWAKTLDRAYASMRSGLVASGYATLRELVDANEDSVEINFWLVENLLQWEDRRYALEVAAQLIPRLLTAGDRTDALELYQRCRRFDAEFRLAAEHRAALAAVAADLGRAGLADELRHAGSR